MSKSDENLNSIIGLLDDPKVIMKKIKKAVTDSDEPPVVRFDKEKTCVSNLMGILSVLEGKSYAEIEAEYADLMYGHLKKNTAQAVIDVLAPIQERFHELRQDEQMLMQMMREGAQKAQLKAERTLRAVKIHWSCCVDLRLSYEKNSQQVCLL